ncbi:DUF115 domain-containing protein [Desulfarculales bacterium]
MAAASPEVACWLKAEVDFANCPEQGAALKACPPGPNPLLERNLTVGGITVVMGGRLLNEVCGLIERMPPSHQVFVLEPRAEVLALGLGRHQVALQVDEGDLVLLAPSEAALEKALHRSLPRQPAPTRGTRGRLYRVLGQAVKARDMAFDWEEPAGANLIRNLCHLAFMGRSIDLISSLQGRPAMLAEAGPSLPAALGSLVGNLGNAALFCSEHALPAVLETGILPTAVAVTNPGPGPLWGYEHPLLASTPLLTEEVAHASTVKAHPGARFLCLGPQVTMPGLFSLLASAFTPQHHCLSRLAEVAALAGCQSLILVEADLHQEGGELRLPGMDGLSVCTSLEQAATANSLGRVLARYGIRTVNTAFRGLGLPGTRQALLSEVLPLLGGAGQPLKAADLEEAWLTTEELAKVAQGLRLAANGATRIWQRAAAPLVDFPCGQGQQAAALLTSADHLFVALAEHMADEFEELAQARRRQDNAFLSDYARQAGHPCLT